ncbi:hypothetical protein XELAEV_18011230mg [Xenopus laevis]|uniref:Uncharacterized protein n=1 Tax=Xenopus laevis TaxID=8355 RepID=A0A974DMV2_XENLA|nr:hypothetical protein XELAEV_18011230mg [Xenopus laevis]
MFLSHSDIYMIMLGSCLSSVTVLQVVLHFPNLFCSCFTGTNLYLMLRPIFPQGGRNLLPDPSYSLSVNRMCRGSQ